MKDDLVERRQKYIRRQIELDKGGVNVNVAGHAPEGSGPANRHGMPQLPVGQHEVPNWPVLDLGEQPDVALPRAVGGPEFVVDESFDSQAPKRPRPGFPQSLA